MIKRREWESIDDSLYLEAGEQAIVCVSSKDNNYLDLMESQAKRVINYLRSTYPDRDFKTKWNNHDFGMYLEILESIEYDDDDDDDDDE